MLDDLAFSLTPRGPKAPVLSRNTSDSRNHPSLRPRPRSKHGLRTEHVLPDAELEAAASRVALGAGVIGLLRQRSDGSKASVVSTQQVSDCERCSPSSDDSDLNLANMRLRVRCERQERTIAELTKQLELRHDTEDVSLGSLSKSRHVAWVASVYEASTQTDDDLMERCEIQQQQLEELYVTTGQKSREVCGLRDTIRLLERERQAQQDLSEQFRAQVVELEVQLRTEMLQKQRSDEQRALLERQLRTAKAGMQNAIHTSQHGGNQRSVVTSLNPAAIGLGTACAADTFAAEARGSARMALWDLQSAASSEEDSDDELSCKDLGVGNKLN